MAAFWASRFLFLFLDALQSLVNEEEVIELQFLVEDLDIPLGIDAAFDMEDGIVLKISDQVADDVHLLEGPKGLIISGGLLVQVRKKGELKESRRPLAGGINLYEAVESHIPHLGQSQGRAFLICQVGRLSGEQTKEGALSNLRKAYQT